MHRKPLIMANYSFLMQQIHSACQYYYKNHGGRKNLVSRVHLREPSGAYADFCRRGIFTKPKHLGNPGAVSLDLTV